MEQILLRQLSSLEQQRFQLTLRCNNKKMSIYHKQLAQYLASNSITVDITEQQDNLLVADKIQILSETKYSNNTITKETLYTGSYCTSVFEYVLSHCKLKCSKNQPLSDLMLKFKIEPIIRFQYHLTGKRKMDKIIKRKDKKEEQEPQKINEIATQRNSVKSNRHLNSHRKNEEDESINPSHHYHGRKCFCCSNRSQDSDQPQSPSNIFCRSPTKPNQNKENSYTRSGRVGEFGKNNKKSPQSQTHPLSIRGNSSQSDRHKNSPNLYFRKHLQTIANKKGSEDSNRNTKLLTSQKPILGQEFANTEQNNWIKTKRNQEILDNKNEMDDDRLTQFKQGTKFPSKIPRNDDKLFHRSLKQKHDNQFKDQENFKDHLNDRLANEHQTMKNSFNITKTQIEQRYSQISAPIDYNKLQTLGGYSHDEKSNNKAYACLEKKINHQRNQSLQSWFKGKKELDPISKMMMNNEKKSNEGANKSKEKGNLTANRILSEKDNLFFDKSSIKIDEKDASKNQSNRIKKIPLTQKMQMLKQNQDKQKSSQRVQAEKIETEQKQAVSTEKREVAPKRTSNSKQIFRSPSMPLKRSQRGINRSTKSSIITPKVQQTKQQEGKEPQLPHEDDNFSVTQEKINKNQANNFIRLSQKEDCEEDKQSKLEKDLATTIKQINFDDQPIERQHNAGEEQKTAPVTENSRVNTSRTIPFRNDIPTPKQQQQQEKKSLQIIEKDEERQSQKQEYFDNLLAQNAQDEENAIINEPENTQVAYNNRSPIKMFNNSQSEQLINREKIQSKQAKVTANSTAYIQHQQSIFGQEEFKSDMLNESLPSQFSSTKQMKIKEDNINGHSVSKNRLSIDSKFPLGIDQQSINKNFKNVNLANSKNSLAENSKESISNTNILSENNLEQFQKQLFDVPKINERQIAREDPKKAKQFLRLETIDEVNQSIYRQNDKKDIQQKSINASVSSIYSSKCSKGKDDHVVSQKLVSEKNIDEGRVEKSEMQKLSSNKSVQSKNFNEEAKQEINEAKLNADERSGKQEIKSEVEEQSPQVIEDKQKLSRLMSDCSSEDAQQQQKIQEHHQQNSSLNKNEVNLKEQLASSERQVVKEGQPLIKDQKFLQNNRQPQIEQCFNFQQDIMAENKQQQDIPKEEEEENNRVALSFGNTQMEESNEIKVQNKQNKDKFPQQINKTNDKVGCERSQEEQIYKKVRNIFKEPKKTQITKKLTQQTEVNEQIRQSQNAQKKLMEQIKAQEAKQQAQIQALKEDNLPYNEILAEKVQQDKVKIHLGQQQSQENKEEPNVSPTVQNSSCPQNDPLPVEQKSILDQKQKDDKATPQHQNEERPTIVTRISGYDEQIPNKQQNSNRPIKSDRVVSKTIQSNPAHVNTREESNKILDESIKQDIQTRKANQDNLHRVQQCEDKQLEQKHSQQVNTFKQQAIDNVLHEAKLTEQNAKPFEGQRLPQIIRKNIEVQTDYILPNEQPENEEFSIYKSQSDHLSKRKCKINLCQPQIVNSYEKFGSVAEITSQKHLKKKNRMQTKVQREHYKFNQKSSETNLFNMENAENESKRQGFQPLPEKFEPQGQVKPDKVGKSSNMKSSNERKEQLLNSKEQERQTHQLTTNPYNLKLQFKEDFYDSQENHPTIINKLIYKNVRILSFHKITLSKPQIQRKLQIIGNCLFFVDKYLPNFLSSLTNIKKTEICLFINNQWTLFKDNTKDFTLQNLLISQLEEESIFKCLEMLTGMPMRILKDKGHEASKKRLIKSVKTLLQKRDEEKTFETVLYGLNKFNQEIISLQKVRYFLDNSKISRSILECKKIHSKKSQQLCNFQGDIINEFIQVFLIKNPRYLTLQVDNTTMNTYQIELTNSIFYVSGNYKFILYEETAKNQYKLTKESFLWLRHKNEQQLTKYLLILEPIPDKKGQTIITMRLATNRQFQEGSHTNRVVKYQNGGKAKGYQGGYENQKNLYLPVVKEIIKTEKKGN